MTFVFVPCRRADEWWSELFPDYSLALLPVAGRPFVEHQLDWAEEQGATRAVVLDHEYDTQLARHLVGDDRRRWSFRLDYRDADLYADEAAVRQRHAELWTEDPDVRVVFGPLFPYRGVLEEIGGVGAFYDINLRLLTAPEDRTPAGYSSEKGVYVGMNVAIKTGHPIEPPVSLGDNVRIEFGARLLGRVVVGRNSIVDAGTELKDTLVFPNTYLGRKMEFRRKIVAGNRVVDVDTGAYTDIEEAGLAGGVKSFSDWGVDAWEYGLTLLLLAVFALPYLVWLPFKPFWGRRLWAYKLSADRYPKLFGVLVGRARLVRGGKTDGPCVFRPSDALTVNPADAASALDNRYYLHHRTIRLTTAIVVKSLVNRLFAKSHERPAF